MEGRIQSSLVVLTNIHDIITLWVVRVEGRIQSSLVVLTNIHDIITLWVVREPVVEES